MKYKIHFSKVTKCVVVTPGPRLRALGPRAFGPKARGPARGPEGPGPHDGPMPQVLGDSSIFKGGKLCIQPLD